MTKIQLQNLDQVELIQIAVSLRILPQNYMKMRQMSVEGRSKEDDAAVFANTFLDEDEREELIDEVFELLAEQHLESLNDLTSPLRESLHKFELELDRTSNLASPLPADYLLNCQGLTKNKLHFMLRDMEWAVVFWQLSSEIQAIIQDEERSLYQRRNGHLPQYEYPTTAGEWEESSLSIVIHESVNMPKFGLQSRPGTSQGSFARAYHRGRVRPSRDGQVAGIRGLGSLEGGAETILYSFSVNSHDYKRYVYLRSNCNYYWTELYKYDIEHHCRLLLARSAIIFKPALLQLDMLAPASSGEEQTIRKLYEFSNSVPKELGASPNFSAASIA